MARIAGVDIPRDKRIDISLTYIFGIANTTAKQIWPGGNVYENARVQDLCNDELDRLRYIVDGTKVEGGSRPEVSLDVKRLQEIGSYRGNRHRRNLPVRGQN